MVLFIDWKEQEICWLWLLRAGMDSQNSSAKRAAQCYPADLLTLSPRVAVCKDARILHRLEETWLNCFCQQNHCEDFCRMLYWDQRSLRQL